MLWPKALAVIAGICGLIGAYFNDRAGSEVLEVSPARQGLKLTAEAAIAQRRWWRRGWLFIGAAFVLGTLSVLTQ